AGTSNGGRCQVLAHSESHEFGDHRFVLRVLPNICRSLTPAVRIAVDGERSRVRGTPEDRAEAGGDEAVGRQREGYAEQEERRVGAYTPIGISPTSSPNWRHKVLALVHRNLQKGLEFPRFPCLSC